MFAGTQMLVEGIISGAFRVGFNPQGAKHHAAFAQSAGFCVFNDMAWAAVAFEQAGLRPLYIDWDIHAGDGVQHLLENSAIPTLSVHNHSAYPGDGETINRELARQDTRHTAHDVDRAIYNWGVNPGDGDDALLWAVTEMRAVIDAHQPDVILLATGADGHSGQGNLGSINEYSYAGFEQAAEMVAAAANVHSAGRVLIGGAGGYQPLDHTPRIWANVVETIYASVTA
jgi:acetoin utilization protein AcuC